MNGREYEQPNITNEQYNELMGYLNMATSQLMDREKELAECKKDLLKLLPIANTLAIDLLLSHSPHWTEKLDREYIEKRKFIDELTEKYANDHNPDVGKKVDEYPEGNEEFSAQVDKVINDKLNGKIDGWLPIESAPRDGTHVFILCPNDRMCVAFYDEKQQFIVGNWHVPVPCLGGFGHGSDTVIHFDEDLPTHWLPLEALPKPPEKEGE